MLHKKVLIVEDSMLIADAVKILLVKEGIDVMITSDGRKVVNIVNKEGVNLIILDLMMPDFSGLDVYHALKADKTAKSVKIMILTAKTDAVRWNPELKDVEKFMSKPFDNDTLVKEVKNLLK